MYRIKSRRRFPSQHPAILPLTVLLRINCKSGWNTDIAACQRYVMPATTNGRVVYSIRIGPEPSTRCGDMVCPVLATLSEPVDCHLYYCQTAGTGSLHLRADSNPWRIPSIAPAGALSDLESPPPPRGTYRQAKLALNSGMIAAHYFQSTSSGDGAAGGGGGGKVSVGSSPGLMIVMPLPRLRPTVAVGRAGESLTAALDQRQQSGERRSQGACQPVVLRSQGTRRRRRLPGLPPMRSRSRARAGSREGADWPLRGKTPSA
jgi:hypothetical protein